MAFHEVRFPTDISRGATGGPERRTEIVALGSGFEERNTPWSQSRRRYNAGYGIKSMNGLHDVIAFFEARRGRLHGFRWKDHTDFKSGKPQNTVTPEDQVIGTGDGATDTFQLVKTYSSGPAAEIRKISKPVTGTVRIAVEGIEVQEDTDYTLDYTTGVVSFVLGSVPAAGQTVTAGFEYDVPARFDTDYLAIDQVALEAGDIPSIPVLEIRL